MGYESYGKQCVEELDRDAAEDYLPTAHDELVEAVLNGEHARARRLVEAGADINALEPDEYPPLCMAVDEMDVDEVRRCSSTAPTRTSRTRMRSGRL